MIASETLAAGEYILGTRTPEGPRPFGKLWVWPRSAATPAPGQWIVELQRGALDATGLPEEHWGELLGRLELHPIALPPRFLETLRSPQPIAIVADTSALHSGAALQVCRIRGGRPTHLAVPDQAYMEIHSQREHETLGGRSSRLVRKNLAMYMAVRHLERLRSAGHVVHFARPPDAMVRYLGAEQGTSAADGEANAAVGPKAPSYVRDRLVIEAARAVLRSAPELPLYVLTADVKLALQVELEQFRSGLCSVPDLPGSLRYGSPWISPHRLEICQLHLDEFLAEIAWTLGSVYLQSNGAAEAQSWVLPEGHDAARLLLRKEKLRPAVFSLPRAGMSSEPDVPKKPPTAQSVVEAIVKLAAGSAKPGNLDEVAAFLIAFGWAERRDGKLVPTATGKEAGTRWQSLESKDAVGWCEWMEMAAGAASRVSTIRSAIAAVQGRPIGAARDEDVKKHLSISGETARKLVVFASAFGAVIRIDGKLWVPSASVDPDAAVLEAIRRVADRSGGSGAPAERVFTDLLSRQPIPLHSFRHAVLALVDRGAVERDRGTATRPPKTGENHVRLRALLPDGKGGAIPQDIDLSHGDFLIPGATMQDLVLRGEAT